MLVTAHRLAPLARHAQRVGCVRVSGAPLHSAAATAVQCTAVPGCLGGEHGLLPPPPPISALIDHIMCMLAPAAAAMQFVSTEGGSNGLQDASTLRASPDEQPASYTPAEEVAGSR